MALQSAPRFCVYCRIKNHDISECRKKAQARNINTNQTSRQNIICYKCNITGHYASQCRAPNTPTTPKNSNSPQNTNINNIPNQNNQNNTRYPNYGDRRSNDFANQDQREVRFNRNIKIYEGDAPIEEFTAHAEPENCEKN